MSPTPTPADLSLDEQARYLARAMMIGELQGRSAWEGLEALQAYRDYLGELSENLPPYDERVTVKIEGQGVRFPNSQALEEFILGVMYGNTDAAG